MCLTTGTGAHGGLAQLRPLSVLLFLKDQYLGVHDNTADSSSSFPRLLLANSPGGGWRSFSA